MRNRNILFMSICLMLSFCFLSCKKDADTSIVFSPYFLEASGESKSYEIQLSYPTKKASYSKMLFYVRTSDGIYYQVSSNPLLMIGDCKSYIEGPWFRVEIPEYRPESMKIKLDRNDTGNERILELISQPPYAIGSCTVRQSVL